MTNTAKNPELFTIIGNLLDCNNLLYRIIQSENENTFMIGLVVDDAIMVIEITVPVSGTYQYAIKCYDVENQFGDDSVKTYITNIYKSISLPDGICVDIGKDGEIIFTITKDIGMPCNEEDVGADINRIVKTCAHNTLKIKDLIIQSKHASKVYDPDRCFIRDLTNMIFVSTNADRNFFTGSITSTIVNEIVSDMNLKHKMEVFRSLSDDTVIMPCYPNEENAKTNYIVGLLRAQVKLNELAYSNNVKLYDTDSLIRTMLRMEIPQQTRMDLICNYINSKSINDDVKQGLLDFYRFMCNDEERGAMFFEKLGIDYLSENSIDLQSTKTYTWGNPF